GGVGGGGVRHGGPAQRGRAALVDRARGCECAARRDAVDRDRRRVFGEAAVLVGDLAANGPAARAVVEIARRDGRRVRAAAGDFERAVVVEIGAVLVAGGRVGRR